MKYYTIEIVTKNSQTSQGIFERADLDTAKKEFHNSLAYNIGAEGVEKVAVSIVDENLQTYKVETWQKPIPPEPPQPEPEDISDDEINALE